MDIFLTGVSYKRKVFWRQLFLLSQFFKHCANHSHKFRQKFWINLFRLKLKEFKLCMALRNICFEWNCYLLTIKSEKKKNSFHLCFNISILKAFLSIVSFHEYHPRNLLDFSPLCFFKCFLPERWHSLVGLFPVVTR